LGPKAGPKPFCIYFAYSQKRRLVAECKAAHARLDAQNVVVHCEHLLDVGQTASLEGNPHLSVINAGEVASAGWLVLLWLQGEGVHVDAGHGVAGVVVVWLHLVEVLAVLLLEAILAVEDQLELVQRTHLVATVGGCASLDCALLDEALVADGGAVLVGEASGASDQQVGVSVLVGQHEVVGGAAERVGHGHVHVGWVGAEVPHGVQVGGGGAVLVAPHQLLHGVVVGQTDQLGGALGQCADGVTAGVLHLLNQVLVALLGEAAALLSVQVHVVGPHLKHRLGEVGVEVGGQVEVEADLVVLQSNQWQVQAWVAVEEKQQRQVHTVSRGAGRGQAGTNCGGHLAVLHLVILGKEDLGVQTPPGLEVLVNALTTDGQLNGCDRTLGDPAHIGLGVVGGQVGLSEGVGRKGHVHVADQIAVAGNGHGHTSGRCGGTVHGLLNVLHREVGVTLVHRLEEGNLGVTSQIHILSAISNELHKSTGHFGIPQEKNLDPISRVLKKIYTNINEGICRDQSRQRY